MALALRAPSIDYTESSLEPDYIDLGIISQESFDIPDEPRSVKNKADPSEQKVFESMKYKINRLNSFRGKWPLDCIKPEDLAEAGLFYLQYEDKVQCPFCYVMIFNWEAGDRPLKEHLRTSPACPFLLSSDVGNVPLSLHTSAPLSKLSPEKSRYSARLASASYKPKHPAMADIKRRLLTYRSWPLAMVTPQQLSECGLFYTGISDNVTCFSCGGVLGNWNLGDDPWVEHSKFFPDCAFLALSKDRYQKPQKLNERSCHMPVKSTAPASLNIIVREQPRNLLSNEIAREAMNIFPESLVKKVILEHFNTEGRNFTSLHELCEAVLVYDEIKSKSAATPVSNYSKLIYSEDRTIENVTGNIKDELLCKICMDREKQIVFIPCGHLIACEKCSQALKNCAVCRKPITKKVRTYLS